MRRQNLADWEVDYGRGPQRVTLPHAWRQDVPVSWEGPALYRTRIQVPAESSWLVFQGVSYSAVVRIDGNHAADRRGIWTEFSIDMGPYSGMSVEIEVEVVKNGGPAFPVREVASGFLPFVFNTFGGIYKKVELVVTERDPVGAAPPPATRIEVKGSKVFVDGKPIYTRGVLSWGWYPELGHANPSRETIRREIEEAKRLGFNLIKFCLWAPPHEYLELLEQAGMFGWMELPFWDPAPTLETQLQTAKELTEIVLQYRHHSNILFWTLGCELSRNVTPEFRSELCRRIQELTKCPLVKDNSGGSEMYGGDPREFGTFYDFHPYCDTQFYPSVLDSLLPGPREAMPLLLGEFNDIDVHRDLHRLKDERPYWASDSEELNAQGVRWQYDLPGVLKGTLAADERRNEELKISSREKARVVRKTVQEAVRARAAISGYVVTGWRDTPVSSSGFVDDWDQARFLKEELVSWNGSSSIFLIPQRRPPWVNGGNRPGWSSLFSHFVGEQYWKVGVHTERKLYGRLDWDLVKYTWNAHWRPGGRVASGSCEPTMIEDLSSLQVGEIMTSIREPGGYLLRAEFGGSTNTWPIWILEKPDFSKFENWSKSDPAGLLDDVDLGRGVNRVVTDLPGDLRDLLFEGGRAVLFLREEGTLPMPFWRESAYEFSNDSFWNRLGFRNRWEQFLSICGDCALDPSWVETLGSEVEVLMNRVDVRTYTEHPVVIRAGNLIATTLRPFGGLGNQPYGTTRNPAGARLLECLLEALEP